MISILLTHPLNIEAIDERHLTELTRTKKLRRNESFRSSISGIQRRIEEIIPRSLTRCRYLPYRVVLFSAAADCHYCHGVRVKCHRGSESFIQCKLLAYPV